MKCYKNRKKFGKSEKTIYLYSVKKNKSINRSIWNIKTKKIMCWEKIKNKICVEVIAIDEEGTEVITRKIIGDAGVHEIYTDIYNELINMNKNVKWKIHHVRLRDIDNIYNDETKEKEVQSWR